MSRTYFTKNLDEIRYWLKQPHVFLTKFTNAWGMCYREGGGSAAFFRKSDLDKLAKLKEITRVKRAWGYEYKPYPPHIHEMFLALREGKA